MSAHISHCRRSKFRALHYGVSIAHVSAQHVKLHLPLVTRCLEYATFELQPCDLWGRSSNSRTNVLFSVGVALTLSSLLLDTWLWQPSFIWYLNVSMAMCRDECMWKDPLCKLSSWHRFGKYSKRYIVFWIHWACIDSLRSVFGSVFWKHESQYHLPCLAWWNAWFLLVSEICYCCRFTVTQFQRCTISGATALLSVPSPLLHWWPLPRKLLLICRNYFFFI